LKHAKQLVQAALFLQELLDDTANTDGTLRLRRSFDGKAGPIQKFVKAVGDSLTVGATAIVVEEDNGGIFARWSEAAIQYQEPRPVVAKQNPAPS
jgi:hypothetical protein